MSSEPLHIVMADEVTHYAGVTFTIITVIISVTILISNSVVIFIFTTVESLQTPSKYFYISLASADFLLGLYAITSFESTSLGYWPYSAAFCEACGYMLNVSAVVSMWSLAALSVDRYLAICHSMNYTRWVTERRCKLICLTIWISSALKYVPTFTMEDVYHYDIKAMLCILHANVEARIAITYICIDYIPILSTLIFCYYKMYFAVKNLIIPAGVQQPDLVRQAQNKKALKTVFVTVGAFFVAWTPAGVATSVGSYVVPALLYFCCIWLAISNSFWNVIIYTATNVNFRNGLTSKIQDLRSRFSSLSE